MNGEGVKEVWRRRWYGVAKTLLWATGMKSESEWRADVPVSMNL